MFTFLKNLPFFKKVPVEAPGPDDIIEEKWTADFSKPGNVRFELKDALSHAGYIESNSLVLQLKRSNCLAWIDDPLFRYGDFVLRADLEIDALGGYAAAGISFRMVDEVTNYIFLVSSRGYFRVDVLRNRNPLPLLGWTEIPRGSDGASPTVRAEIIAQGNHFIFILNGLWAAELYDDTLTEGRIGFVSASYEAGPRKQRQEPPRVSKAYLHSFTIESRITEVETVYSAWLGEEKKGIPSRRHLAETLFAMGKADECLAQLKMIWDSAGYKRENDDLLLAAKASLMRMELKEAETYIDAIRAAPGSEMERAAGLEKARLLYLAERYGELKEYIRGLMEKGHSGLALWNFLGHSYWNLKDYRAAAEAYDEAAALDTENGLPAKNAGNAYDILGDEKKALDRYLKAGRYFLKNDNYEDLGSVIPRLLFLDPKNWEVHALAGKWAFGVEDWRKAEDEFSEAERLRQAGEVPAEDDPALVFLRGLLLIQKGKRKEALPFLEKALALDDEHSVFHFKLAENRFLLYGNPGDEEMKKHIALALKLDSGDGWIANLAAQIALAAGDLDTAADHLAAAAESLGEVPAIRVNRAVLAFLKGSVDEALEILESNRSEDPSGMMANCAGNLLVRLSRFEEAEGYYRKALSIAPANIEYMVNHASCLIEMGLYGEADALLAQAHSIQATAEILELIAFVAAQKSEYARAETALASALELDPQNVSVYLSLGWMYANTFRWKELEKTLDSIKSLPLNDEYQEQYRELRKQFEEATYKTIQCSGCERNWKVSREITGAPPLRIFSEPPDDMPAGTCPGCGKTYCIGCAKKSLDEDGRFLCGDCGKNLKLSDPGLKTIIAEWAAGVISEKDGPETDGDNTP